MSADATRPSFALTYIQPLTEVFHGKKVSSWFVYDPDLTITADFRSARKVASNREITRPWVSASRRAKRRLDSAGRNARVNEVSGMRGAIRIDITDRWMRKSGCKCQPDGRCTDRCFIAGRISRFTEGNTLLSKVPRKRRILAVKEIAAGRSMKIYRD